MEGLEGRRGNYVIILSSQKEGKGKGGKEGREGEGKEGKGEKGGKGRKGGKKGRREKGKGKKGKGKEDRPIDEGWGRRNCLHPQVVSTPQDDTLSTRDPI